MVSDKKKLKSWPEKVFFGTIILRRDYKNGIYLFCSACEKTGIKKKGIRMRHTFTVQNCKDRKEIVFNIKRP